MKPLLDKLDKLKKLLTVIMVILTGVTIAGCFDDEKAWAERCESLGEEEIHEILDNPQFERLFYNLADDLNIDLKVLRQLKHNLDTNNSTLTELLDDLKKLCLHSPYEFVAQLMNSFGVNPADAADILEDKRSLERMIKLINSTFEEQLTKKELLKYLREERDWITDSFILSGIVVSEESATGATDPNEPTIQVPLGHIDYLIFPVNITAPLVVEVGEVFSLFAVVPIIDAENELSGSLNISSPAHFEIDQPKKTILIGHQTPEVLADDALTFYSLGVCNEAKKGVIDLVFDFNDTIEIDNSSHSLTIDCIAPQPTPQFEGNTETPYHEISLVDKQFEVEGQLIGAISIAIKYPEVSQVLDEIIVLGAIINSSTDVTLKNIEVSLSEELSLYKEPAILPPHNFVFQLVCDKETNTHGKAELFFTLGKEGKEETLKKSIHVQCLSGLTTSHTSEGRGGGIGGAIGSKPKASSSCREKEADALYFFSLGVAGNKEELDILLESNKRPEEKMAHLVERSEKETISEHIIENDTLTDFTQFISLTVENTFCDGELVNSIVINEEHTNPPDFELREGEFDDGCDIDNLIEELNGIVITC